MWTPLTETILNQVLNAGELASVTRDRAQVQPDPIPGILAETAARMQPHCLRRPHQVTGKP